MTPTLPWPATWSAAIGAQGTATTRASATAARHGRRAALTTTGDQGAQDRGPHDGEAEGQGAQVGLGHEGAEQGPGGGGPERPPGEADGRADQPGPDREDDQGRDPGEGQAVEGQLVVRGQHDDPGDRARQGTLGPGHGQADPRPAHRDQGQAGQHEVRRVVAAEGGERGGPVEPGRTRVVEAEAVRQLPHPLVQVGGAHGGDQRLHEVGHERDGAVPHRADAGPHRQPGHHADDQDQHAPSPRVGPPPAGQPGPGPTRWAAAGPRPFRRRRLHPAHDALSGAGRDAGAGGGPRRPDLVRGPGGDVRRRISSAWPAARRSRHPSRLSHRRGGPARLTAPHRPSERR